MLDVPHSTLQAWHLYQDRLDTRSEVVAFVPSIPGLAFLHHLVSLVQVDPQRERYAWHRSKPRHNYRYMCAELSGINLTVLQGTRIGFDHGAGRPLLFLDDAKAPNYRKNNGFKD